ncbi:MAG TPA: helix-turn-helix domain-containing protein [Pyrinomonadaceae bacterium]|nr:helix-turn-helix domain-containing protein [Pyrinomonadaceae bacterium]
MEQKLLIAEEVAKLLRVDKQRVYELVRTQKIPFVRVGDRQYRFSANAVQRWMEAGGSRREENGNA